MTDLIKRLETAEQGSRELDGYIAVALGWRHTELGSELDQYLEPTDGQDPLKWMDFGDGWIPPCELGPGEYLEKHGKGALRSASSAGMWDFPAVTTDLSAAVALVERVLQGKLDKILFHPSEAFVWHQHQPFRISARAATPALALCIALLRALNANTKERT